MMTNLMRRLRDEERGYALVVAMLLMAVMMVSMVVALEAGNSALQETDRSVKWARTLAVAESGIENAKTTLSQNRSATTTCAVGGTAVCSTEGGEYQVSWTTAGSGTVTVTSTGFYPSKARSIFTRQIQVLLSPEPAFKYALFSNSTMDVKTGAVIQGGIYSTSSVTVQNNATICGKIVTPTGNVTLSNGVLVTKALHTASVECSGEEGSVWAGGTITNSATTTIWGDATASGSTNCDAGHTTYRILSGTIYGDAIACNAITGVTGATSQSPYTSTSSASVQTMPSFTYVDASYPGRTCYPSTGTCGPTNTSATAASTMSTWLKNHYTTLTGTHVVWQTSPSSSTKVNFDLPPGQNTFNLTGDFTLITNAPVDLGNTVAFTSSVPATLTIISLYVPPAGSTCDATGSTNCSIFAKNQITLAQGSLTDETDGIAGLFYTSGLMAFQNGLVGDGAAYASSVGIFNNMTVHYNGRIAQVLGFGGSLGESRWQELSD